MAKQIAITKPQAPRTGNPQVDKALEAIRRALEEIQTELQRLENNKQDA